MDKPVNSQEQQDENYSQDNPQTAIYSQYNLAQYTDRPDLLLETIEKHRPGAIANMHDDMIEMMKRDENARFNFGKAQAYTSLVVSVIGALSAIALAFYSMSKGHAFSGVVASVIFYAVTQGGLSGFNKIIDAIHSWVTKQKNN